jgi:hypothetical protein
MQPETNQMTNKSVYDVRVRHLIVMLISSKGRKVGKHLTCELLFRFYRTFIDKTRLSSAVLNCGKTLEHGRWLCRHRDRRLRGVGTVLGIAAMVGTVVSGRSSPLWSPELANACESTVGFHCRREGRWSKLCCGGVGPGRATRGPGATCYERWTRFSATINP